MTNDPVLYGGDSKPLAEGLTELPAQDAFSDAEKYIADEGLRDALNVAILLGQPLLIAGLPGTGKTQLAYSAALAYKMRDRLFVFHTKSTTAATDLFYEYDAIGHYHAALVSKAQEVPAEPYITFNALGRAILMAQKREDNPDYYEPEFLKGAPQQRAMVLIDEIDKAPRDVPNDLLDEIEHMHFSIRQLRNPKRGNAVREIHGDPKYKPLVILTSNSEKDLPDPFLRRCVYYYIGFPGPKLLREIVQRHFKPSDAELAIIENAIPHFETHIQKEPLRRVPATAELLAWTRLLLRKGLNPVNPAHNAEVIRTFTVLAKNKADLDLLAAMQKRVVV